MIENAFENCNLKNWRNSIIKVEQKMAWVFEIITSKFNEEVCCAKFYHYFSVGICFKIPQCFLNSGMLH